MDNCIVYRKPGVGDLGQYGLVLPVGLGPLPPQVTISGVPSNYETGTLRTHSNLGMIGNSLKLFFKLN